MRSLVLISTTDIHAAPLARGSGFFFKPNLVATNLHVLTGASRGEIEIVGAGLRYRISEIVGVDRTHDVCVLKIDGVSAPALSLSTSRQDAVGDDIYVAGNPEGLKGSLSKGIISAIRKDQALIQIDASISPGSSGGPVINSRGEAIGITVGALTSGQHLNFAIPAAFLSSLPLEFHLPVHLVGALAVTDKENEGLRGRVKTVRESYYMNTELERANLNLPNTIVSAFDVNGNQTEYTRYDDNGGVAFRELREYDSRGFKIRGRIIIPSGKVDRQDEWSAPEWIAEWYRHRHYDNTYDEGDDTVTYDSNGNEIERTRKSSDGAKIQYISKFDRGGNVVEFKEFQNGRLVGSCRYAYEADSYGNWTKRVISSPQANCAPQVIYREITYYPD